MSPNDNTYRASKGLVKLKNKIAEHFVVRSAKPITWNAIGFNRKDRAKRYHISSIVNLQYSIPACPG